MKSTGEKFNVEDFSTAVLPRGKIIDPIKEDVAAFHRQGGYLDRFAAEEAMLIEKYPLG